MNRYVRNLIYRITGKSIDEAKLDVERVKLSFDEILYFNLSTNPIISFDYSGKRYYFRECPPLASKKQHLKNAIENFFRYLDRFGIDEKNFAQKIPIKTSFSEDLKNGFRQYITDKSENKRFEKILIKADELSEKLGFSIWKDFDYNDDFFSSFGMEDLPDSYRDIAVNFLWSMRSSAYGFRTLRSSRGSKYSFFSAVRSVASMIVAEELGLEHLVTKNSFCILEFEDGKNVFGVLSPAAKGSRMADVKIEPNGEMQRELMCLNYLDAVCYQTDHRPNNYNVFTDKDGKTSVCAFDNDNPNTFFPIPSVSSSLSGCSPLVDKNGDFARPFFDKNIAEKVFDIDAKRLKTRLKPYLSSIQIAATASRLKKLGKALEMSVENKKTVLLSETEWNDETVAEELKNCRLITYLSQSFK